MWCWLVGWLACTEVLVMPVVDGPRCVGVGTSLSFSLEGVLHMDEHGFLNCPGLAVNFLVYYAELVGAHGMACGGTVLVYGGRSLEVFLDSIT